MMLLLLFLGLLALLTALVVGFRLLEQLVSVNAHLAKLGLQVTDFDDRLEAGLFQPEIERGILAVEEECARVRGHVAGSKCRSNGSSAMRESEVNHVTAAKRLTQGRRRVGVSPGFRRQRPPRITASFSTSLWCFLGRSNLRKPAAHPQG